MTHIYQKTSKFAQSGLCGQNYVTLLLDEHMVMLLLYILQ